MMGLKSSPSLFADRRSRTAVISSISPSSIMSLAITHSASAVRFPTRVWSSHSFLFSTVNSTSHMSL
jgi:hypothetical protein